MTDSVALHRLVSGPLEAPPLVALNALGTSLDMWDPQAAELARHFRLVRYDQRGHGGTRAVPGPYEIADLGQDLLALLDEPGIHPAHLVGASIGAMVAIWVAATAPDRVDRLVLSGTSARLGPPGAWAARAALVLDEGMAAVAEAVVARWLTPAHAAANPELVERLRAMILGVDPTGYAGCCLAIERMDLTDMLRDIRAPTLVLHGADDPAIGVDHAERIVAAVPDSRLIVLTGAAHLPNLQHPERFARLVTDHLGVVAAEATT